MQRSEQIKKILTEIFFPTYLEVIDDSEKHIGHAGAQNGAGHYKVIISANDLQGLSRIAAHQKIYAALSDLIPEQIHALNIKIK